MKANELRIGNFINGGIIALIKQRYDDGPYEIEVMQDSGISYLVSSEDATPTQLTEKWLLWFGFEKDTTKHATFFLIALKTVNFQTLKGLCLYFEQLEGIWTICFTDYYTGAEKTEMFPYAIKYVHQLQNLYFALTGEELIIKP